MKRKPENKALPARWRYKHGAYYYRVPDNAREHWDGKSDFRLGKSLAEAHATFAKRIGYEGRVTTMCQLCDRYALEVVTDKAPATQKSNAYSLARIRKAFAGNHVASILPKHIYEYRDFIGKTESKKKANLDLEVLSHMFTNSIEWGIRNDHPMTNKKVRKFKLDNRKVRPTPEAVVKFITTLPRKWQLYVLLDIWTARRKGELLRFQKQDMLEEGMRFRDNKPPYDEIIVPWESETRAIVTEILKLPESKRAGSVYLFSTRDGQPYMKEDGDASGFNSIMWRYLSKYRAEGGLHFTLHDLRKFRPSQLPVKQAQSLLNHSSQKTTETYHLAPKVVDIGSK